MKLIELIERGVDYDDILYHDDWALGMRMHKDLGDAFVYCYPETGEFIKEHIDRIGYKRVVLCKKILIDDKWRKQKIVKKTTVPKYKINDRFLLPTLYYKKSGMSKNVIGEIIAYYRDDDTGNVLYTVSVDGGDSPLLLNEKYLSKLDMIVSQNN